MKKFDLKLLFLLLISQAFPVLVYGQVAITGKIESCDGWPLKRFPQLKEFVKYGGAEIFENLEIEFRAGSNAVLTVYHDGNEDETVELTNHKTKDGFHKLLLDKGFVC